MASDGPQKISGLSGDISDTQETAPGRLKCYSRMFLLVLYFIVGCMAICISQIVGIPFYLYDKRYYYAWMSVTKEHFGLLITTMTQWWCPTVIYVCGDRSVRGQLRQTIDGRLEVEFPERLILIANHQIYTDWLYLWWITYTNRMHGHIYIVLKESLKYIPILGQGMTFFGFLFLSRKWAADKARFQYRLQKLNDKYYDSLAGKEVLNPMWLLLFPEGTNLSRNGREMSRRWAEKQGLQDLRHCILPRSTGLQFCLQNMAESVDWVYDCTMAYEGIPHGEYGQDVYTLFSTYFKGRPPKSVSLYFRRYRMASIPTFDDDAFECWLRDRWIEKDKILEYYAKNGEFPAGVGEKESEEDPFSTEKISKGAGHIKTTVRPSNSFEFLQIFNPGVTFLVMFKYAFKALSFAMGSSGRIYGYQSTT